MVTYHQKSNFVSLDGVPTELRQAREKIPKALQSPVISHLSPSIFPPPSPLPPPLPWKRERRKGEKKRRFTWSPPSSQRGGWETKKFGPRKLLSLASTSEPPTLDQRMYSYPIEERKIRKFFYLHPTPTRELTSPIKKVD